MTYTRLNPDITSGTPTAANSHVSVGSYSWWRKYGRIVVACANFNDSSPSANSEILTGYPAPSDGVAIAVVGGSPGRCVLSTSGKLIWDGSSYASGWVNAQFSYLSAT